MKYNVIMNFGDIPFKSKDVLMKHIKNVNEMLLPDGHYMGSFIDAEWMKGLMKGKGSLQQIQEGGVRYTKLFNNNNSNKYGQIIGKIDKSGQKVEYLIDKSVFINTLKYVGFTLKHSQRSGVIRYFMFKKPDKTYSHNNGYKYFNYNY